MGPEESLRAGHERGGRRHQIIMVMVIMFPGPKAGGTFTGPRHPPTGAGKALARWKFSSDVAGSRLKPTLPKDLVQSDEETLLALSDSRGKLRRRAGSRAEVRAVQEVCLQGSGGGHFAQDSCPPPPPSPHPAHWAHVACPPPKRAPTAGTAMTLQATREEKAVAKERGWEEEKAGKEGGPNACNAL